MSLLPDELASPRIRYHSKSGITSDIGIYEKKTAPDAVGYLEYYTQPDKTQNVFKTLYIPLVSTGDTTASEVRIHVAGVTRAFKRRGIIAGTKTRWDIGGQGPWASGAINLRTGIRKEASSTSFNVRIYCRARSFTFLRVFKGGFSSRHRFYETIMTSPPWPWESTPVFDRTFTWDGNDMYIEMSSSKLFPDIRDRFVEVWR